LRKLSDLAWSTSTLGCLPPKRARTCSSTC
jgi:hypothetical protein